MLDAYLEKCYNLIKISTNEVKDAKMDKQEKLNKFIALIKDSNSEEEKEAIMWEAFEDYGRKFAEELATLIESE